MQTERLIRNMMDQVKELQIKLGYAKETIRLYYPLSSLRVLLCEGSGEAEAQKLLTELQENPALQESGLGHLNFSLHGERFEVNIPPEGAEYVHEQVEASAFLVDLIGLFQDHHHCDLEEIRKVFAKHAATTGSGYICEQMPEGTDFDYVMYFKDPSIDEYYYCIKMEMGHTIYHRFMREDYEA